VTGAFSINRKDCITGYGSVGFYDWDLYFETLFLSYFGMSNFARNNVELFLDTQHPSGFVSRTIRTPRERQPFKPFLAQTSLLVSRQRQDFRWLDGKYYERLKNIWIIGSGIATQTRTGCVSGATPTPAAWTIRYADWGIPTLWNLRA